ncbi:MAG: hypothetical protein ABR518_00490 [Actinomycetota bacterium]
MTAARRLAVAAAAVAAVFFLFTGAWAFLAPRSFFDVVATYPPYNQHLFHDSGAFQLGVAAALLAGSAGRNALAVGLWGGAVGTTLHAVSHWIDADLGGRESDPYLLTLLAAFVVAGLIAAEVRR